MIPEAVLDCTTSLIQNSVLNMDIILYNKLPEKNKEFAWSNNFKKELKSILLKNAFYTLKEYLQAAM